MKTDTEQQIVLEHICKDYDLYADSGKMLLDFLRPGKNSAGRYRALDDITFSVQRGEIIGVIGLNGSGKSTLGRVICGISVPSSGKLTVNGSVDILAPASGMMPKLTGMENITYKLLLMGISPGKIPDLIPEIVAFADIGQYIYQPVRTYSSGMRSRLGFAISIETDPDILIIDEALAVGDRSFVEKCKKQMRKFIDTGKSVIFISHSVDQLKNFCDRVIWLHKGRIAAIGDTGKIIHAYKAFVDDYSHAVTEERDKTVIPENYITE